MTTAHDEALRTERTLTEATWKLILLLIEKRLRYPLSISPERESDFGPRLRVQVESRDFRSYFVHVETPVMRTLEHEGATHVHVIGQLCCVPLHLVSVLDAGEEL
jgi:hypothetical protein